MDLQTITGTIGVSLLLLAYFLQLVKYLKADGAAYLIINLVGALLAAYSSYLIDFIPFIVLELTWALVSFVSLVKSFQSSTA